MLRPKVIISPLNPKSAMEKVEKCHRTGVSLFRCEVHFEYNGIKIVSPSGGYVRVTKKSVKDNKLVTSLETMERCVAFGYPYIITQFTREQLEIIHKSKIDENN